MPSGTQVYPFKVLTLPNGVESIAGIASVPVVKSVRTESGTLGFAFTVGAVDIVVTHLGRWKIAGNNGTYTVALYNSSGTMLSGGSVSVNQTGETDDSYVYAALASPITLTAGTRYECLSACDSSGWYEQENFTSSGHITGLTSVYSPGNEFLSGKAYVPANFLFDLEGSGTGNGPGRNSGTQVYPFLSLVELSSGSSDATGSSSLTFAASTTGNSLADLIGSSSITFAASDTGDSGTLSDATGSTSLTFAVSSTGNSVSDATGSTSLTFAVSSTSNSVSDATGSTSLTFAVSSTADALATATGSSSLTFTVSADSESTAAIGSTSLTFAVSSTGNSVSDATCSTSLTFAVSSTGNSVSDATCSTSLTFAASATYSDSVEATGSSNLTFAASATGNSVADVIGSSGLTFSTSAVATAIKEAIALSTLTFSASAVDSSVPVIPIRTIRRKMRDRVIKRNW